MTFFRDFDNYAETARARQAEILHANASSQGRRPGAPLAMGIMLAVVCAPLAALFFLQVW